MKILLMLTLLINFSAYAKNSNREGNLNSDGIKVVYYNLCLRNETGNEGKKYYQDPTGAITPVGTGTCSIVTLPKYDVCQPDGFAYRWFDDVHLRRVKKKNSTEDLPCKRD